MNADPDPAKAVFLEAVERHDPDQWPAFLDRACAGRPDLRGRVDALLEAHREVGTVPPRDPAEGVHPGLVATVDQALPSDRPGTVIGPYKLIELIGEGGMGTVWMAQQTEPVKRLVAVKLIKAGMDSKQVLARFEAERQALALMDHPNIARVLDAGTTTAGRPYFVMDLVKGVPVTRYCDEHRLTPKQRLELFVPVCQALQHAHQKGVIHRDVKPSNVLVALYDGRPVPKVIDFGVAKAAGQPLTEQTMVTGFGAVVGTLEYMSPEQAEVNQLDIDTRSDIYSLGVMLYELLAGSPPFTRKELETAGMLEMLRVIREQEPSRPSAKLSTADGLPTLAANRGTEPAKLTRMVRGELDWIVMKALEKDRNRRYESANGFAMDVQRYLADEPVQACPPSAGYRLRKFARRNRVKLAVAGSTLVLLILLCAEGGWIIRDRAERRARATHDLELALDRAELLLEQGKRPEVLAALDRADLLVNQSRGDRTLDGRLAALKERLAADVRDREFVACYEDIRLRVESQVNLVESRFAQEAALPEIRAALSRYGIAIGGVAPAQAAVLIRSRPEQVRRNLVAALDDCLRKTPTTDPQTRQWLLTVLEAGDNDPWRERIRQAGVAGDRNAVERMAREVDVRTQPPAFLLLVARSVPTEFWPTRLELFRSIQHAYPADLWANHGLAWELQENGSFAEAIRYYTAALALRPESPAIYLNRGSALLRAGEVDGAIRDLRRCLDLAPQYAMAHAALGGALADARRWTEAIAECREAIKLDSKLPLAWCNRGHIYAGINQYEKSRDDSATAIDLDPNYALAWANRGNANVQLGQYEKAVADCSEAIRLDPKLAPAWYNRGAANAGLKRYDACLADCTKAVELNPADPWAHYNLAMALHFKGRPDEATAEYREALRLKEDYPEAHSNLAVRLVLTGQFGEALAHFRRAEELGAKIPGWPYPTAQMVRQCERLVELDGKLPGFLERNSTPASPAERIELATMCSYKRCYYATACFYEGAFSADPKLADDRAAGHRYNAACAAALAGCGKGKDAAKIDDTERARLRQRALGWLRADLGALGHMLDTGAASVGSAGGVRITLSQWQVDSDLAGVRSEEAMAKLPEAERAAWRQLWGDVAAALRRAQAVPEKKSTAK